MNDSTEASPAIAPALPSSRHNAVTAAWHWWTGELRAMVPPRLMNWVVGEVAVTDVMVDDSGISLIRAEAGKARVYATIARAEVATHPVLRELRAKGNQQVRVLLGADQVLQKTITLPAAIEENLREAMGFELDRHTPFMSSQAYFDVRLLKRDASRETIQVLLVVAPRAAIDALLALVRQAGLSVNGVTVGGETEAGQTIELLPESDKPARKWGNLLKLNLALLATVMLAGLVALLLPIWQKREAVIALNPLVGKAGADFEVSQRVHDEYTKLAGEYNYITGRKQSMHASLTILEELSKISPDTTAAQSMELKSTGKTREVTLIGEAQAASKVIETLEQSPLFQNASQRSQTRKGSLGTNEWFHVATEVKPRALPAALPIDAIPAEPAVTSQAPVSANPAAVTEPDKKAAAAGAPTTKPDTNTGGNASPAAKPVPTEAANPQPTSNRKQP